MPYLPIDPKDLGRNYDAVIRVNSQSGKGGISYLLESERGLELPRRLQIEFSSAVQAAMDAQGGEFSAADIWAIFERQYRLADGQVHIEDLHMDGTANGQMQIKATVRAGGHALAVAGIGSGPIAAFVDGVQRATGVALEVLDFHEHAIGSGAQARAAAYLELRVADERTLFGVGIDANIVAASMKAVVCGLLRCDVAMRQIATPLAA